MKLTTIYGSCIILLTALTGCGGGSGEPSSPSNESNTPYGIQMGGARQGIALSLNNSTTSTLAGTPTSTDGIGGAANFSATGQTASDGVNLYIVDTESNLIRKLVIATGEVTTLAGKASQWGTEDAIGDAARFNSPTGIAYLSNNLYITDTSSSTIRKLDLNTNLVTTIAGSPGSSGNNDGIGTDARFNHPAHITTDGVDLYVSDRYNHTVRKIVPATRQVTTLAGVPGSPGNTNGIGAAARFNYPIGIISIGTNLYVGDTSNNMIRKIDTLTGNVTTLAGSTSGYADGTGLSAKFDRIEGIGTDGVNIYAADSNNNVVRKVVVATGVVSTLAGNISVPGSSDGVGTSASFYHPNNVMGAGGNLYVSGKERTVRKIEIASAAVSTIAGSAIDKDGGTTDARFYAPAAITTDGINLYVLDYNQFSIRKVVIASGTVSTLAGSGFITDYMDSIGNLARFSDATGITTDGTNLYITEKYKCTIRKIVIETGEVTTFAGSKGIAGSADGMGADARFYSPSDITTDGSSLYVADSGANTIRKIDIATAAVTTLAGEHAVSGGNDGYGTAAHFNAPAGITTDGTNLFVTDYGNQTIRKIVIATGEVSTLAGSVGITGAGDGPATVATFKSPRGITTDGTNVYVSDNSTLIRQISTATGDVTTLAGQENQFGYTNGSGNIARFNFPAGLTTDGKQLFIADQDNSVIRTLK